MRTGDLLILKAAEVASLVTGQELTLINLVRMAYEAHAMGQSSLPHSTFLRFPGDNRNRIIALPAYLGQDFGVAGIKWISSFPDNINAGMERASAVVVLNSLATGQPEAIVEGAIISAKRTAASAALAARTLHQTECDAVGLFGCGLINFEVARSLLAIFPAIKNFAIFDVSAARADDFKKRCQSLRPQVKVEIAQDVTRLLRSSRLISIATTATTPHVFSLADCESASTILHISLRDLAPELILECDNIADDVDHVCRAQTSVHLAEQLTGGREFVRCALADILTGKEPPRRDADGIAVFSPFGLGVLDMAVAKFVYELALKQGMGTVIESFLS
jgi:2,3-diaminopropionate biosynthesis protein SbnB